jgi:hypothetical protein
MSNTNRTHRTKPLPPTPNRHPPPRPSRPPRKPLPPIPANRNPGQNAAPNTGPTAVPGGHTAPPTVPKPPTVPHTNGTPVNRRPLPPIPSRTPPRGWPQPGRMTRNAPPTTITTPNTRPNTRPNPVPNTRPNAGPTPIIRPRPNPGPAPITATLGPARGRGPLTIKPLQARLDLGDLGLPEATQLSMAVQPAHADKVFDLVDDIRRSGPGTMRTADLVSMLDRVGAIVDSISQGATVVGTDRESRLALAYVAGQRGRQTVTTMLGSKGGLAAPHARALADFLTKNPALAAYLRRRNIKVKFSSGQASSYGEGVFLRHVLHLGDLDSVRPATFVRFFLHEAGHATYQRLVVPHELQSTGESQIPEVMRTGEAHTLLSRKAALVDQLTGVAGAVQGTDSPDLSILDPNDPRFSDLLSKIDDLDQELTRKEVDRIWASWPEPAKRLYNAWLVLRQNNGQYLMGIDLERGADPASRRAYQAGGFNEFCAETFMQYATGLLPGHLNGIQTSPTVPDDVKSAWNDTRAILTQYAGRQILRR